MTKELLATNGFALTSSVLTAEDCTTLIQAVDRVAEARRQGGVRNLLQLVPDVAALATSTNLRAITVPILGPHAFPVRVILFDKTPAANWRVFWHQDLSIAVRERVAVPGFGPWSRKGGVPHVQAPPAVLEHMVAVRIHLDECGPNDGPLRVIPGSHRLGVLGRPAIDELRQHSPAVTVLAPRGAAVVMRPLLLHASSPATYPAHRRVLHVEYAANALPGGLQWHAACQAPRAA